MERICPICNGLQSFRRFCPYCGQEMEERGALQDFIDEYSPYLSREMGETLTRSRDCVHLYYCPTCHQDNRVSTPMWTI